MGEPAAERNKGTVEELWIACYVGDSETVRVVLAAGVSPLPMGDRSLVAIAAYESNARIVRMLLDAGVDVNARSPRDGCTALHLTRGPQGAEIVRMLAAAGAHMDALDNKGMVALHHAELGHDGYGIIEALLECGADPNRTNAAGMTPLMCAILRARKGTAAAAAALGSRLLRLLLTHHANPNQQSLDMDQMKITPLCAAVRYGNPIEHVAALLDAGAGVNGRDKDRNNTPLTTAARVDRLDVVQMLVARGADRHATGFGGLTARQQCFLVKGPGTNSAGKFLEAMDKRDAATLCRATHVRLGSDSPASLLAGFPEIAAFIVFHAFDGSSPAPVLP